MNDLNQDSSRALDAASALGRRHWMHLMSSSCLGLGLAGTVQPAQGSETPRGQPPAAMPAPLAGRALNMRIGVETLRNPFWYAEHGHNAEAEQFWDQKHWDRILKGWSAEGYNYL